MLRQSYDNYSEKGHNKLYQAVTQGSSIFAKNISPVMCFAHFFIKHNELKILFQFIIFDQFTVFIWGK